MVRAVRNNDWGFPRWRAYDGTRREAERQRPCDHVGCTRPGTCPAPKAPNRPERWWFCEEHAAEYNRQWNYFDQLSEEDAARFEADEQREQRGWRQAQHWGWGEGDGSRSQAELDALRLLGLAVDASDDEIKAAWRRLAMDHHPDRNPGNTHAAAQFQAVQAAYEVLRRAKELRERQQQRRNRS